MFQRDLRQQQDELLATPARQQIGLAGALPQQGSHAHQQLVTGGVAPSIVDLLEIVHVQQHHGVGVAEAQRLLADALGLRHEPAPVEQAAERVPLGLGLQPLGLVRADALVQVGQHGDEHEGAHALPEGIRRERSLAPEQRGAGDIGRQENHEAREREDRTEAQAPEVEVGDGKQRDPDGPLRAVRQLRETAQQEHGKQQPVGEPQGQARKARPPAEQQHQRRQYRNAHRRAGDHEIAGQVVTDGNHDPEQRQQAQQLHGDGGALVRRDRFCGGTHLEGTPPGLVCGIISNWCQLGTQAVIEGTRICKPSLSKKHSS